MSIVPGVDDAILWRESAERMKAQRDALLAACEKADVIVTDWIDGNLKSKLALNAVGEVISAAIAAAKAQE